MSLKLLRLKFCNRPKWAPKSWEGWGSRRLRPWYPKNILPKNLSLRAYREARQSYFLAFCRQILREILVGQIWQEFWRLSLSLSLSLSVSHSLSVSLSLSPSFSFLFSPFSLPPSPASFSFFFVFPLLWLLSLLMLERMHRCPGRPGSRPMEVWVAGSHGTCRQCALATNWTALCLEVAGWKCPKGTLQKGTLREFTSILLEFY